MQAPRVARSSRMLSRLVLGGLVIGVLVDLVSIVHELAGPTVIDRYLAGTVDVTDLRAWDSTFGTIALSQSGIFILTAILWLAWQYRIVASVEPLTHDAPVKTPARSVGWWFVPFANLVVVPRIYSDLKDKLTSPGGSMVGWWWGSYIVANATTNFASRIWGTVDSPESFRSGINLWIASDVLTIVAAALAFRLVRHLQDGQDRLIAAPPSPVSVNTLAQGMPPTTG